MLITLVSSKGSGETVGGGVLSLYGFRGKALWQKMVLEHFQRANNEPSRQARLSLHLSDCWKSHVAAHMSLYETYSP